jgi:hypothetical protein
MYLKWLCCYVWKLGFMILLCSGIHDDDTPGDLVVSVYEYVGFIIA